MHQENKHVIMLAAENDALINGKVGGLADVIRDLPYALSDFGIEITVITPAYGFLHKDNPSRFLSNISFPFKGQILNGDLWEVKPKQSKENVTHLVFEHPEIRGQQIYTQDTPANPFAQDATKYALFSSAVGQYLKTFQPTTIIHLHDWHLGFLLLLREIHPEFIHLKQNKIVFTIHNLVYQGTRPFFAKEASVNQWFPELFENQSWIDEWRDPRYKALQFTPMAAAVRFSDKVNTVSISYAEEILQPSNHKNGYYGGEGLEKFLNEAKAHNRLYGILNGIDYGKNINSKLNSFTELCNLVINDVRNANQSHPDEYHDFLLSRIDNIQSMQPKVILSSVTRITEQKVRLLFETGRDGISAMDKILEILNRCDGLYVIIGNGTIEFEKKCKEKSMQHERLLYINIYSAKISNALYETGSIFMMPSLYEPCGISQMIAMKNGQPCIVHAVGGLKDTVIDGVNGFQFSGNTIREKIDTFISVTNKAIDIYLNDKPSWEKIKREALMARFEWKESAKKYIELLYQPILDT